MEKSWFLVANASEARLFEKNGKTNGLECINSFEHPQSRSKEADLITDGPGRYDNNGSAHGDYESKTSPKSHEKEVFARELAQKLESARTRNSFERLIIVASPQFHGMLNKHLSNQVKAKVTRHVEKDYTGTRDMDMWDRLKPHILPA